MKEFLNLRQGNMTVMKYEKRFIELTKYAITFILDKKDKCKQIKEGLRIVIPVPVMASANWSDFSKLVEASLRENMLAEEGRNWKGRRSSRDLNYGKGSGKGFSK